MFKTFIFLCILNISGSQRRKTLLFPTYLLIFGLTLSVLLIATVATFFAEYIKKHSWVGIVGLFIILLVALQLIGGGIESQYPGTIPEPFKSWL